MVTPCHCACHPMMGTTPDALACAELPHCKLSALLILSADHSTNVHDDGGVSDAQYQESVMRDIIALQDQPGA